MSTRTIAFLVAMAIESIGSPNVGAVHIADIMRPKQPAMQTNQAPRREKLDPSVSAVMTALRGVTKMAVFVFPEPCWPCHERDLDMAALLRGTELTELTEPQAHSVIGMLIDPGSYIGTLAKPCPFVADSGLRIGAKDATAFLLFSSACQTARLVRSGNETPVIVNIDPVAARLLPKLKEFTRRKLSA